MAWERYEWSATSGALNVGRHMWGAGWNGLRPGAAALARSALADLKGALWRRGARARRAPRARAAQHQAEGQQARDQHGIENEFGRPGLHQHNKMQNRGGGGDIDQPMQALPSGST